MTESRRREASRIDQVEEALEGKFLEAVPCKIDSDNRTARIGRIEIRLKTTQYHIPGGWCAKIGLLRGTGVDDRVALVDTIPLPAIAPQVASAIGPFVVDEMSEDVISSSDPWHLELFIVDPCKGEKLLFRSLPMVFKRFRMTAPSQINGLLKTLEDLVAMIDKIREAAHRQEIAGNFDRASHYRWQLEKQEAIRHNIECDLRKLGIEI